MQSPSHLVSPDASSEIPLRSPLDLLRNLTDVASVALTTTGIVVFGPSGILILLSRPSLLSPDLGIYFLALTVWFVGLTPLGRRQRAAIQTAACFILMTLPILDPLPGSEYWIPLPFIAFAITFSAAYSFRAPAALFVMALAAEVNWLIVLNPGTRVILPGADILGGAVGPLFILITGPCLIVVNQSWIAAAKRADAERAALLEGVIRNDRDLVLRAARDSVDRRIHETLLNTLTHLSSPVRESEVEQVRAECRHDLEQATQIQPRHEPILLSKAVDESVKANLGSRVEVLVNIGVDFLLTPLVADSIRDAIVEALRNVERHSGASAARIEAHLNATTLTIIISDNGSGIAPHAIERFGVRNTLRASMQAIGGSATIVGQSGIGSTVTLSLPNAPSITPYAAARPTSESTNNSIAARLGMISPSIMGLLLLIEMPRTLTPALPTMALFLLYFFLNLGLAFAWQTRIRIPLALATLGAAASTYAVTQASIDGCTSSSTVHWLIISVTGSMFLISFTLTTTWGQWLSLPLLTLLAVWMAFGLPVNCRGVPIMAILTTTIYVSAAIFCVNWLFARKDSRQRHAEDLWEQSEAQRTEIARQQSIAQRWNSISVTTRDLLLGISDGDLDPTAAMVQARCAACVCEIRATLTDPAGNSGLWRTVAEMVASASALGKSVDAHAVALSEKSARLPLVIHEAMIGTAVNAEDHMVIVNAFIDVGQEEVVVTGPSEVMIAHWSRAGVPAGPHRSFMVEDCTVTLNADGQPDSVKTLSINVSRPV